MIEFFYKSPPVNYHNLVYEIGNFPCTNLDLGVFRGLQAGRGPCRCVESTGLGQ